MFLCFSLYFSFFSLFLFVSLCFSLFLFVFLCFSLFLCVFLCFLCAGPPSRNSDGSEQQRAVTVASPQDRRCGRTLNPKILLWVALGWECKSARAAWVTGPPHHFVEEALTPARACKLQTLNHASWDIFGCPICAQLVFVWTQLGPNSDISWTHTLTRTSEVHP